MYSETDSIESSSSVEMSNLCFWNYFVLSVSALGAGVPYNREKNESLICPPPPAHTHTHKKNLTNLPPPPKKKRPKK